MATVIPGQPRTALKHYGLYRTHLGGDLPVIVRRDCGNPSYWLHGNSPRVRDQRLRFAEASHHYSTLTPPQKWLIRNRYAWVYSATAGCPSELKLLKGRQLAISEDIVELAVTGTYKKQPISICIVLCDEDYNPLTGTLHLEYLESGIWWEVTGRELLTGNWLFVETPPGKEAYRVWGEAVGYQDPMKPENQFMSEKELKAKHWHIMEIPPMVEEYTHPFFSDGFPHKIAVDGFTSRELSYYGESWSSLHDGPGTHGTHTGLSGFVNISSGNNTNMWRYLYRSMFLFFTGYIPDNATILAAEIRLWGTYTFNTANWPNFKYGIVLAHPASNEEITPADYNDYGMALCSSDVIPHANWKVGDWNIFHLNALGLEYIIKDGVSRFGIREVTYDIGDKAPEWAKRKAMIIHFDSVEAAIEAHKPRLVVKYEVPLV